MLFKETVAVYCENRTEHTDTLCGKNARVFGLEQGYLYLKAYGTYSNH
jgi:hypothetical protein